MAKKVFTDESLQTFVDEIKAGLDSKSSTSHTHKYAGSSSAGGAATSANKVNSSLTVKLNSGTTEGTNQFTFNGSSAKSVNITPSSIGAATSSHTHDDRYYTESEVDTKLSGKANTSHGNHVPATQTASNKVFLRNDNTWATVTPANIGAAASSHTHKVANISDLTATATELNYMDGVTSNVQAQLDGKASSSHKHTVSQISDLTATAAELNKLDGVTATTTELNYVDGVTSNIQTQLNSKITNNPFDGSGTSGEKGYIAFAQLKITQNYANKPIEFELICRGKQTPCYVSIVFSNSDTTDPSIASLKYCGTDYGIFAVKSTTSTWLLYHTKTEAYDNVTIARIQAASQGITITYPGTFITTKPTSGVTNASLGGSVASATTATSATKATQDASGNTITSTYATKSELNTAKSNLQASIDAKQATITGGASTITGSNLTANRALISNGSGKVAVSAVTSTELGYLDGVTSNVQTQLDSKASKSAATTSANGLMTSAMVTKLNGIAEGANKYSLPTASSSTLGGVKTTSTVTSNSGYTACPIISGVPYYKDTNTTYSLSSFGITATAAELNYCDGVTSNIQTQLNNKANASHSHSYLPLSGGTVTGGLIVSNNNVVANGFKVGNTTYGGGTIELYASMPFIDFHFGNSTNDYTSRIWEPSSGLLEIENVNGLHVPKGGITTGANTISYFGGTFAVSGLTTLQDVATTARVQPDGDETRYCGSSSQKWKAVYCKNSTNTTSDLTKKNNIKQIDDRYIKLFDLIQPYTYMFNNGDRVHTGFISQYVEEAMKQVGLTAEELGFFCKDIKEKAVFDENGNWLRSDKVYDENGNPEYEYALRYGEYIAIMAEKIKRLETTYNDKIGKLEAKLIELEDKITK